MWDYPEILRQALGRDEELLWSGQPRGGIQLRASDVLMIPFSLVWGGFVLFWEASALMMGAPTFMLLWGIPFVLVGLYLVFGRFLVDAMVRSRTYYGLTNQRVLIATDFFGQRVTSIELGSLGGLTLSQRADGSGTITFGSYPQFATWFGQSWPSTRRAAPPSFEFIDNAREVHDRILEAQRALKQESP